MRNLFRSGLLLVAAGASLLSCLSGDPDVGQSVINPYELQTQYIDSVTVQTATIIAPDSFVTSTDTNMLVGRWNDSQMGQMTAKGFTLVDYAANEIGGQQNLRLDSLVLELGYSFSYGDTLSPFVLQVHSLLQPLTTGQTYYNYEAAAYSSTPLLQASFQATNKEKARTVRMRIPNDLAQAFFTKLVNKEIYDTESMSAFWKGFALVGQSTANVFWGFSTSSTQTGIRLYYHTNDMAQSRSSVQFPLQLTHFTQLVNDAAGSALQSLKYPTDILSSNLTGHTTVVSTGAGFRTRIVFPYLNQFSKPDAFIGLNMAQLQISPIRRVLTDNTAPPDQLALYQTNSQNDLLATVPAMADGSTDAVASYAYLPNELELSDMYVFDLTQYVGQIMRGQTPNRPLILMVPVSQVTLKTAVQRVFLGDQQRSTDRIKLRILLTSGT